ncbi:MAG: tRNA uridine-5-carboxymethylaminomethyl(34) synthesis GTPase MnmE [Candidatus Omnitrophica bacterium]|nr:tRNA uridine-5-carboxymethylaminomethyl(34) synthesis GTPase MnmE [Candidatus Omnitrophota bacterium]
MTDDLSNDTIAAIATPIGTGGISVIRLSGPRAFEIGDKVFRSHKKVLLSSLPSHTVHYGEIRTDSGDVLDQVLVILFRAPRSYTGEDVVEISSHGGLVVTRRILDLLIRSGARHAQPGEFTKRAFLNGKMDLTQAEAVLDVIKAKSDRAQEAAVGQLTGLLSKKFRWIKDELMHLHAHMEACLDFPDEHLEIESHDQMKQRLRHVQDEIRRLIASFKRGALLREGLVTVIVGKPNVGKSSLFNALLEKDRALVSEYPGTTRDRLEELIEIDGMLIRLVDTAGLAPTSVHPLDRLGIEMTRQMLREGHLFLYIVDVSSPLEEADRVVYEEIRSLGKPILVLAGKCDLWKQLDFDALNRLTGGKKVLQISAKTRDGLSELEEEISAVVVDGHLEKAGEQITRLRHRNALEAALDSLGRAEKGLEDAISLEFVIVDLKAALDAMRELIGEIYSEDLLDIIFSEFCIGK